MADFMVAGVRYREFGFSSKGEAEAWELEARAALKRGLPVPSAGDREGVRKADEKTLNYLVRYCAKNHWVGKKSERVLVRNAELFLEFVGADRPIREGLSQLSVDEYVSHLRDETEACGSTINRRLSSVSVLLDYATRLGLLDRAPRLAWQKEGEHRFRWFTDAETTVVFSTLRGLGLGGMAALFEFLLDTGCRVGEALKLEFSGVSNRGRTYVTFWDTKNGKARSVPLTARAEAALRVPENHKGSKPFGAITRHAIRFAWSRLRGLLPWLSDAVVHTFRHTCASWLVQRGIDLMRVKEWMGHLSIATTLRYAKLAPIHLEALAGALENPVTNAGDNVDKAAYA